jgi:hypothetical protein
MAANPDLTRRSSLSFSGKSGTKFAKTLKSFRKSRRISLKIELKETAAC